MFLKEEPVFIHPYSSFKIIPGVSAAHVLSEITKALSMSQCDCKLFFQKGKIKGVVYSYSEQCAFNVQLYKCKSEDQNMSCEFQRISGCVYLFNMLYRRTLKTIINYVSTENTKFNWLEPVYTSETISEPLEESTLNNVISMICCDTLDIQSQGARALVNISMYRQNLDLLAELHYKTSPNSSIVLILDKLINSDSRELIHFGCVFLFDLASQVPLRTILIDKFLGTLLHLLNESTTLQTLNIRRQVALIVSVLAESHYSAILSHSKGYLLYDSIQKLYNEQCIADVALKSSTSTTMWFLSGPHGDRDCEKTGCPTTLLKV